MKKIYTYCILLICFFAKAQETGSITLNWSDKKNIPFSDFNVVIPQFQKEAFNYDIELRKLSFVKKINTNALVDEKSIVITNIQYENISKEYLGDLNTENIPNSPQLEFKNIISRDKTMALLRFSPLLKDGDGYKKILSLSYSYKYTNGNSITYKTSSSITNSVLASGSWKRFYIQKSGIYKITKSFLNQIGISTDGLDPRKIKIYGNGGRMIPLLNNIAYPYDIEENAIQVIGENDGSFDDSDYILFYGEGVDKI